MKTIHAAWLLPLFLALPHQASCELSDEEWGANAAVVATRYEGNRQDDDFVGAYIEYINQLYGFYTEAANSRSMDSFRSQRKFAILIYLNALLARQYASDHAETVSAEKRAETASVVNAATAIIRELSLDGPRLREARAAFRRSLSDYPKFYLRGA